MAVATSNQLVIDALKAGREKRPIKISGRCFSDNDKACALGAIALGLGYNWESTELIDNEREVYDFLENYMTSSVWGKIYRTNDDSWQWDINQEAYAMVRDPDEAVIEYLNSLDG